MIIIEAEFTGDDIRLKKGDRYNIMLLKNMAFIRVGLLVTLDCPYESIQSFLKNWNKINIIEYEN